jgi:hypothetical protein
MHVLMKLFRFAIEDIDVADERQLVGGLFRYLSGGRHADRGSQQGVDMFS